MRKGFWNGKEEITYRVIMIEIEKPVETTKLHWQNAFVGTERQVVEVVHERPGREQHKFYIDNEDGSGIKKIEEGGGPGSMSRHLEVGTFKIISELHLISEWNAWSQEKCSEIYEDIKEWQEKNHPVEFAALQRLEDAWRTSEYNQNSKNYKFK